MKVLFINSVYKYGSTGRIIETLCNYLDSNGDSYKVLYGRFNQNREHYINNNINIVTDVTKSLIFNNHGFNSERNTYKIISQIKDYTPDIIHIHNLHGFYCNIEILLEFLKQYNKPIIFTLHDCWSFTGFCAHYESNNCNNFKKGCHNCMFKNTYPYKFFLNKKRTVINLKKKLDLFNSLDNITFIAPSLWMYNQLNNSMLNGYFKVINNGIDLNNFYVEDNYDYEEEIILGVANKWTKKKGLEDFVKLSEMLDKKYKIILVGLDEKQIKKMPSNIIGIRKTQSIHELRKLYNSAKVFVNLTYEDTFPTVNIEALACGTQVITYNTGGSGEIIQECGYIVDKGDLNSVLKNIKLIKKNKTTISNCQKRALKLYSSDCMLKGYYKLYNECINNGE